MLKRAEGGEPLAYRGNRIGLVYFVQVGKSGLIKIGFTTNLPQRLEKLRCGHPTKLNLIGAVPGTIHDERRWHRELAEFRRAGEWFSPHPLWTHKMMAAIVDHRTITGDGNAAGDKTQAGQ